MGKRLRLIRELGRMVRKRKLWFLTPFLMMLVFAMFILIIMESPALLPFFYAIF